MDREENAVRMARHLADEPILKYLYENHITPENHPAHEAELRRLLPDDAAYAAFVRNYLTQRELLSCRTFLKPPQRMDAFMHPRYIQQTPHIHDFFEMKYQLAGSGTVHVGGRLIFMRAGDVCLISPYVAHSSEVYTDDAEMVNLVLPAWNLEALFPRLMGFPNPLRDYFQRGRQSALIAEADRCLYCETGREEAIRRIIGEVLAHFTRRGRRSPAMELAAEAALERALLLLLDRLPQPGQDARPGMEDATVAAAVDCIRANLRQATLAQVAEALHFSPAYTSRFIKRHTGYTFQMLLLILRMEAAARLLEETDMPVDRIAGDVGLSGRTNFYKKFRGLYGMNPGEFRDRLNK